MQYVLVLIFTLASGESNRINVPVSSAAECFERGVLETQGSPSVTFRCDMTFGERKV